ncbi:hypothetical protein, partial [Nocardioides sp.]|uniref:hypothetical protein n=1 Tax=Nocardioides sp. TaxID=35761 RepID=UPI00261D5386
MARGTRLRRIVRSLLMVVPVLALLVAGLQAPASAATATISGRVTLTAGGPAPAGTKVLVRPAGGGTALASTTADASTGAYSLSVTAGPVDVVVNAPEGSGFGQTIVTGIDASVDRIVDVQLAPSDSVTVSGVVRDGQGSPMPGV